jgi:hypothetical protein
MINQESDPRVYHPVFLIDSPLISDPSFEELFKS